jgi:hypothetical protein
VRLRHAVAAATAAVLAPVSVAEPANGLDVYVTGGLCYVAVNGYTDAATVWCTSGAYRAAVRCDATDGRADYTAYSLTWRTAPNKSTAYCSMFGRRGNAYSGFAARP